jgi:hypothetical protein
LILLKWLSKSFQPDINQNPAMESTLLNDWFQTMIFREITVKTFDGGWWLMGASVH